MWGKLLQVVVVGVWLFVLWGMFLCLNQIWGHVCQCMCHSFVAFVYWGCVYGNFPCVIGSPVFLMWRMSIVYSNVSHACCGSIISCANLEFGLLVLNLWKHSSKRVREILPACDMYCNWQSFHFSWYTPLLFGMLVLCCLVSDDFLSC
jgi:hypothetical protein